jgi:hypothetical protein
MVREKLKTAGAAMWSSAETVFADAQYIQEFQAPTLI